MSDSETSSGRELECDFGIGYKNVEFYSNAIIGSEDWWMDAIAHDDEQHGERLFTDDVEAELFSGRTIPRVVRGVDQHVMHEMYVRARSMYYPYSRVEQTNILQQASSVGVDYQLADQLKAVQSEVRDVVSFINGGADSVPDGCGLAFDGELTEASYAHPLPERLTVNEDPTAAVAAVFLDFVANAPTQDLSALDTGAIGARKLIVDDRFLDSDPAIGTLSSTYGQSVSRSDAGFLLDAAMSEQRLSGLDPDVMQCLFQIVMFPPWLQEVFVRVLVFPGDVYKDVSGLHGIVARSCSVVLRWYEQREQLAAFVRARIKSTNTAWRRLSRLFGLIRVYQQNPGTARRLLLRDCAEEKIVLYAFFGTSDVLLRAAGYNWCGTCECVVKSAEHDSRCRPRVRGADGLRDAAWLGDALHKLDMRYALHAMKIPFADRERRLLAYTTNVAMAEYVRQHMASKYVYGASAHRMGTLFEASYHGEFRDTYLRRVLGDDVAEQVLARYATGV